MNYPEHVKELFKKHGWRCTVNIQNVTYLLDNTSVLLSPRDIFLRLRKKANHKTDLSTVYRALQKLEELDLVYEIHGKYIKNYDSDSTNASPHFLICQECDSVEEIFLEYNLKSITKQLQKEKGFSLNRMSINFRGTCRDCIIKKEEM